MNSRLLASKEACTYPRSCRAKRHRRSEAATVGNPSCCYDRSWRYGIDHRRYEGHASDGTANMPACFPTLRHDYIDTAVLHCARLSRAGRGVKDHGSASVGAMDKVAGIAPEKEMMG